MRALNAGTASAGGYTVGTNVLASDMIELLRNKMLVARLGARVLTGLQGDIAIPRHTGGATAYWLSETATVTGSQQTFGQLALTPHRLGATTAYSKQLLAQSSLAIEAFVREDLMTTLALEKDRAALNGSNASGEPLGLLNCNGIGGVTFGAAATWTKVVEFETDVSSGNADTARAAFLTTPAVRGKWKTIPKVTGYPVFLWEKGMVNDYPAEVTNQVPSDKVIFGDWSQIILADWDGLDVVVDPYTLATEGQVRVVIHTLTDVGLRQVASFSVSADSGAQ
jgi:HK97 family phage major capsid protein